MELADWLLQFQLTSTTMPYLSVSDYADALADAGMVRYRERIETAWRAVGPGNRWELDRLMEDVIRVGGDVDELVAYLAAKPDGRGWQHLRIAGELDVAGRSPPEGFPHRA